MALRKCTATDANEAAIKYGCKDEHDLKKHVATGYYSGSGEFCVG